MLFNIKSKLPLYTFSMLIFCLYTLDGCLLCARHCLRYCPREYRRKLSSFACENLQRGEKQADKCASELTAHSNTCYEGNGARRGRMRASEGTARRDQGQWQTEGPDLLRSRPPGETGRGKGGSHGEGWGAVFPALPHWLPPGTRWNEHFRERDTFRLRMLSI